jgi:hypothetical protein
MGGYLRRKLEPHREVLEAPRTEKPDITPGALRPVVGRAWGPNRHVDESRFFRRIVTLKKRGSFGGSRTVRT